VKVDTIRGGGTPFMVDVIFYGRLNSLVGDLTASVHASYFN